MTPQTCGPADPADGNPRRPGHGQPRDPSGHPDAYPARVADPAAASVVAADAGRPVVPIAGRPAVTRWTVPCADAGGRERLLSVRTTGAGVVLGLPAGESATVDSDQLRMLRGVLDVAQARQVGE